MTQDDYEYCKEQIPIVVARAAEGVIPAVIEIMIQEEFQRLEELMRETDNQRR